MRPRSNITASRQREPTGGPARIVRRARPIPVYGAIPAGLPEDRSQEPEDFLVLDLESLGLPKPSARIFALRVQGDSMEGAGILDGDYAIIEHGKEPRNGAVVAAFIDGKSVLKRFVLRNGKPFLKSENPRYRELVPAEELVIQGVMVGLFRKME